MAEPGTPAEERTSSRDSSPDDSSETRQERDGAADSLHEPLRQSLVAPHDDPLLDTAVRRIEAGATPSRPFGMPGAPLNQRSPFRIGFSAALGVALAYVLLLAVAEARAVLLLIALSAFLAIGLDRPTRWLERKGAPRSRAVALVFALVLAMTAGFVAVVVPPIVDQSTEFATQLPGYVQELSENENVARLDERYGVVEQVTDYLTRGDVVGGLLGAGQFVLSAFGSALLVLVLTLYLLASLPSIKTFAYRLAPRSRRARVGLLADGMLLRIGGFVSGAVTIAVIAGTTSFVWLFVVGVPYALALALVVAAFDLVPLVGATIAAVVVTSVSFVEGTAVGVATGVFFIVYQQVENYLLYPRVMARTVALSPVATIVAVLLGGALLGVLGALLAIPTSAALQLVVSEVVVPRQDRA